MGRHRSGSSPFLVEGSMGRHRSGSSPFLVEGSMGRHRFGFLALLPVEQATQGKEGNTFSYLASATRFVDSVLGGP